MKTVNLTYSRRALLSSAGCLGLLAIAGCANRGEQPAPTIVKKPKNAESHTVYSAIDDEKFPIPAISKDSLEPKFERQRVRYATPETPGTVIVDTRNFYLYHVARNGFAMRYGVGLGRAGFEWSGRAHIAWKRKWPKWTPPNDMIKRQPELAKWSAANGGMPPGLKNPLGARALYIFQGAKDTLYRLHGTLEVDSIGQAVSSGCVRLLNHDIIDLYTRVRPGSRIIVT